MRTRFLGAASIAWIIAFAPRAVPAEQVDAALEVGQWFTGRIAFAGDEDLVTVPGLAGTSLTVSAVPLKGSKAAPRAEVRFGGATLEPSFVKKKGKKGKGQKLVGVPVETTGVHEIVVTGDGAGLGEYLLKIHEHLPAKTKGTLAPGDAGSVLALPARPGVLLTLRLTGKGGDVPLPELLGPAGQALDLSGYVSSAKGGKLLVIGPLLLQEDGVHSVSFPVDGAGLAGQVRVLAELDDAALPQKEIGVEPAGSAVVRGAVTLGDGYWLSGESAPLAADDLLLKLAPGADDDAVVAELGRAIVSRSGAWVRTARVGASVGGLATSAAARAALRREAIAAARHPAVLAAEPNSLRAPFHAPIDPLYLEQWDLPRAGFEHAWDLQPGDPGRTVAVLDTGVRFDHPDLAPRLIAGYDFVGDTWNAGDGDGWDPDATDPFVTVGTHGSHVTGTIAAAHGNGVGTVGGTLQGSVLPVRVLGVLGGTDFDIAQGILYAARLPNASGQLPLARAEVINMSLGGPNYSAILADAVAAAIEAGVVVVAAAGNANSDKPMYPAAYPGVVTVSATDMVDERAWYSSFGPHVNLAAPGGDPKKDKDGDGEKDGVLSTVFDPVLGPKWGRKSGTSMAAPHVAAAAFLLRSQDPTLTPGLVAAYLAAGARDLGAPGFDVEYGHGLLDAGRSLQIAAGAGGGPPAVFHDPAAPTFTVVQEEVRLAVVNPGGGGSVAITGVTTDAFWLEVVDVAGVTPCELRLRSHREGLAPGTYDGEVTLHSSVGDTVVPVRLDFDDDGPIGVSRVCVVAVDEVTGEVAGSLWVDEDTAGAFELPGLPEGTYRIVAATDLDFDGVVGEDHDYVAEWQGPSAGAVPLPDGTDLSVDLEVAAGAALGTGPITIPNS